MSRKTKGPLGPLVGMTCCAKDTPCLPGGKYLMTRKPSVLEKRDQTLL